MRITVAAVGKLKSGPEREIWDLYARRLTWDLTLKEVEDKKKVDGAEKMAREARLLDQAAPAGAYRIALDRGGTQMDSIRFANQIQEWMNRGASELVFLIGGADGLDPELTANCTTRLSFGAMTWPHFLARGLLLEQLYRAQCILTNHPYHR